MLDIESSPAVALVQGAEVSRWALCWDCLLFPINLDGSNEEDEFPQGERVTYLTLLQA